MDDLISRQDVLCLIKNLYPSEPIFRANRKKWLDENKSYIELERLIKDLPSAQQWIPCSERPPKEMGTYMTTIDYGKHGIVSGQRYYYGQNLGWMDDCVIAWKPLPEPWKGD